MKLLYNEEEFFARNSFCTKLLNFSLTLFLAKLEMIGARVGSSGLNLF